MEFKDYYAELGVDSAATAEQIKKAYRKLARKFHPDVSKEPDAEARFKDVSEAYEALHDPEKRAAYDEVVRTRSSGAAFRPPPDWNSGYEFSGREAPGDNAAFSDFFESLFGRQRSGPSPRPVEQGSDHHAKIVIGLAEAYQGGRRMIVLRMPTPDGQGGVTLQERQLEITIPKGVRGGQHLRLSGQGSAGPAGTPSGDLFLEIAFAPHPYFRLEGRDVYLELPVAPWEAALGGPVRAPTPDGSVQLSIPKGSASGRKLRLKGKGLPSDPPGDLYVVLTVEAPPATTPAGEEAYAALARAFAEFNPRSHLED